MGIFPVPFFFGVYMTEEIITDSMGNPEGYTHKPSLVPDGKGKPFPVMIDDKNKFIDNLAERRKREDNNT